MRGTSMNILNKLTITDLKLNKKRTIVTVIGIALATALICAVLGMITSFKQTMINYAINQTGDYHVKFYDIPKDQAKYITQNNTVEKYFLEHDIGYAKLDKVEYNFKPYYYVIAFNQDSLNNNGLVLTSGRLPKNDTEVVIEDSINSTGNMNLKAGDKLTLNIGTRVDNSGNKVTQNTPMQENNAYNDVKIDENITDTKEHTYIIVGTIQRVNNTLESFDAPGYTVITYEDTKDILNESNVSIAVRYKDSKSFSVNTKNILNTLKTNTNQDFTTTKNTDLLEDEGNLDSQTLKVLYGLGAIIVGIIVATGIFTTRNAFAISVSEKTKQYGMLSSIGATSKQIKKSVVTEGMIIGLIAIPLGLLIGIIATAILVQVVNFYLADEINNNSKLIFSVPYYIYLLDALLSFITIYLSCIIPARRASKISPIDAIRATDDIKIDAKKLKTSKLVSNTLGIGGIIADKNLKRNKKKYRTTVISLVISITTFIILYSFMQYGNATVNNIYQYSTYNVIGYIVKQDTYKEYAKLENNYAFFTIQSGTFSIDTYGTDYAKQNYNKLSTYTSDTRDFIINIVVYNNDYFKKYLKDLGLNENDYDKDVILYDKLTTKDNGKIKVTKLLNDTNKITVKVDKNIDFNITKTVQKYAMGSETIYNSPVILFVSEDYAKSNNMHITDLTGDIAFNTKDANKLEKELNDLKKTLNDNDIEIQNMESLTRQENNLITLVSIFLYGFIIVISLIGVTNVFNTITTSMMLRSKEFAMLKSIGMTKKEFNHMIRLESIMYGLKSLIIGIPLGLLGSYGIYHILSSKIDFGYIFPTAGVLISILFIFIIVSLTMHYALNKVNKQNIIETIRQDNI